VQEMSTVQLAKHLIKKSNNFSSNTTATEEMCKK